MAFRSKKFYYISFITCVVLALVVKAIRKLYFDYNEIIAIMLGSLPSFLCVFGLISAVPIFKKNIEIPEYFKIAFFLTLGSLAYELEQIFSSYVFDIYDVYAIVIAFLLILGLHSFEQPQT